MRNDWKDLYRFGYPLSSINNFCDFPKNLSAISLNLFRNLTENSFSMNIKSTMKKAYQQSQFQIMIESILTDTKSTQFLILL